jgi:ketosteroid isomerase-like protein
MKRIFLATTLCGFLSMVAYADSAKEAQEATAQFRQAIATWNKGDLNGYIQGYEDSPGTLLFVNSQLYEGYKNIAKRYHTDFSSAGSMGHLTLEDFTVNVLDANYVMFYGHWQIEHNGQGKVLETHQGIFSTFYKKTPKGWKVVIDHSFRS